MSLLNQLKKEIKCVLRLFIFYIQSKLNTLKKKNYGTFYITGILLPNLLGIVGLLQENFHMVLNLPG